MTVLRPSNVYTVKCQTQFSFKLLLCKVVSVLVHGAPVVSSYFFSVLYFYVIFVLPIIVK